MKVTYYIPTAKVIERHDEREIDVETGSIKIIHNGNSYLISDYGDDLYIVGRGSIVTKTFSGKSIRLDQE